MFDLLFVIAVMIVLKLAAQTGTPTQTVATNFERCKLLFIYY